MSNKYEDTADIFSDHAFIIYSMDDLGLPILCPTVSAIIVI